MKLRHPFNVWRRFKQIVLPVLLLLSFSLTLLVNPPSGLAQQQPREIRGVWMTLNDKDIISDRGKLQDATNKLAQLGFNTVYPVVWNSGYAMYPSNLTQQMKIQAFAYRGNEGQDTLADLVAQGHAYGMKVIPWFEFGFMTPPSSELAMRHPEWLTQKLDGSQTSVSDAGEVSWLNPFHPQVQQFLTNLVLEIVTQYDADGIQFDDHMSLPIEFGFDDYTIAQYIKETKRKAPTNPQDQAWMRWRADKITAFMAKLSATVKQQKPNLIFSVSPNYYDFAYKFHLQDWLAWVRRGIVDELVVQVYRSDLQSFSEQISRPEILEAQQKISTGIGVLTGLRNRPVLMPQIESQVRALQQRGLGVSFFYYESLWDDAPESLTDRFSGFAQLFAYPSPRSDVSGADLMKRS